MPIAIVIAIFLLLVVMLVYRMFADLCVRRKDEKQTFESDFVSPHEDEARIPEEAQLPGSKR